MNRDELRSASLARLEERTIEHPSGHQGKLAARYLMRRLNGDVAELMFEKGPKSATNLWVAEKYVTELLADGAFEFRHAPAKALFTTTGANGQLNYGRHSALRPMKQLGHADLIFFRINTVDELDRILEHLS